MKIKEPNVANAFYPGDSEELTTLIEKCFQQSHKTPAIPDLKAIVAPHAGYIFSGPVAASAYQAIEAIKEQVKTVVVFSPSHFHAFEGLAISDATHFRTPLGDIEIDQLNQDKIKGLQQTQIAPLAFEREHALEVHLPFLQKVLNDFKIIPLIVGRTSPEDVKEIIELLDGPGVFFVVSSDLSHFHDYQSCQSIDKRTSKSITEKDLDHISGNDACGYYPLRGLLLWAKEKGLTVTNVDLRNSGDTAGDKSRVVGYGSYLVH